MSERRRDAAAAKRGRYAEYVRMLCVCAREDSLTAALFTRARRLAAMGGVGRRRRGLSPRHLGARRGKSAREVLRLPPVLHRRADRRGQARHASSYVRPITGLTHYTLLTGCTSWIPRLDSLFEGAGLRQVTSQRGPTSTPFLMVWQEIVWLTMEELSHTLDGQGKGEGLRRLIREGYEESRRGNVVSVDRFTVVGQKPLEG